MWSAIGAVLQILFLIFKNQFEKDKEKREQKRLLYEESKLAIGSRDVTRITNLLERLRK